jgi:hypothetical protein
VSSAPERGDVTTKATLRARILSDLERDQATWGTMIDDAIGDAITFHQSKRFYFNESRTVIFSTVAGTEMYTFNTPTLVGTIGAEFYRIDDVQITIGASVTRLRRVGYDWLEQTADNNQAQGQPYNYAYVGRQMRIYPNPGQVYAVRIVGHQKFDAPDDDSVDDNVWMNEGFELIRSRAKAQFAMHVIEDEAMAQRMQIMERSALGALRESTYRKVEGGMIVPTQF